MADTFKTKLGTTRAGERSRIWIEGARLIAHGFNAKRLFLKSWFEDDGRLVLTLMTAREAQTYRAASIGTVSGKEGAKPIIDITGELVRTTFGTGTHVNVKYAPGRITAEHV
jgi:hypothetical protein